MGADRDALASAGTRSWPAGPPRLSASEIFAQAQAAHDRFEQECDGVAWAGVVAAGWWLLLRPMGAHGR